MKKILAIQADPISEINLSTDTTLLLAYYAQKKLYKIYWYQTKNLSFERGNIYAVAEEIQFFENKNKFYKIIKKKKIKLSSCKFVLIRQNPPFNMDYIRSTLYLDYLPKKTKVINNPTSIRNISEKFYSINFTKFMPPTIFTRNINEIKNFYTKYKKIIIKPINGYAGKNILFIDKKSKLSQLKKYLSIYGHVMVQKFLPNIKYGDKRVFIINGKVKGVIRRIPLKNSILSNISQGGKAFKTKLNKKEQYISTYLAKKLKSKQIFFAGIDLVDNYLIGDINVTSPTGLPQYYKLTGKNLAKDFWYEAENLK